MEQQVAEYLASGRTGRVRGARQANANDEIVASERGAPMASRPRSGDAAARETPPPTAAPRASARQEYEEFERLLQMREERLPRPGEPRPPRDTKRSVDAKRLSNLQPRDRRDR